MKISVSFSKSSRVFLKTFVLVFGISFPVTASSFNPAPLFEEVNKYETTITTSGDRADIYYPDTSTAENFPVALLLQGALVDKADYTDFASTVASYGFIVIVPNNFQSFPELGLEGLLAEVSQIDEVLAYVETENSNSTSPLEGIIDTDNLALLGHSWGGAVGLSAIGNYCIPRVCNEEFTPPEEIVAGIFYGTYLQDFSSGEFLAIDNNSIPIGLISGSRDGVSTPEEISPSYEVIEDSPKALITVEGANHYGITNEDNLERDPLRPTLEQDIANETIARWSALFLRASIFNEPDAFDYIYNTGATLDPNVTVISETFSETSSVPEPISFVSLLIVSLLGFINKRI